MAFVDFLVDFFFFIFFVMGSSTIGYFFLRVGWPKIRVLGKEYKQGWSVIFGASFALSTTVFAFIFSFLPFFGLGFREYFFLFISLCFLFVIVALTLVRKYYRKPTLTVSIPRDFLHAKVVAQKAKKQLELDPGLVIVNEPQKVESIKTVFENRKKDSLMQMIPEKNRTAQKSSAQADNSFVGMQVSELFEEEPAPVMEQPVQKNNEEVKKQLESKLDLIKSWSEEKDESEEGDLQEIEQMRKEFEKENEGKEENPLEKILKEKKDKLKYLQEGEK